MTRNGIIASPTPHPKIRISAKSRILLLILLMMSFFIESSIASQLPRYLGNEKKFRSYVYNPNDVHRYIGHYTY